MQKAIGDDHEAPSPKRDEMMAELKAKYRTVIFASTVAKSVRERGMVFEVEDATGRRWKGRKVILATGHRDTIPDIPGFQEAWGKNM
jgi:thioredoxin reductase